jgi:putative spermidine/putrescine transport system substrate-binding protein
VALLAARPGHAADLVIGGFGGVWERAARACFVAPFEQATGKTVAIELGTSEQWLNQIAADPAHPPLDVVLNSIDIADGAIRRGLVEKMDATHVPALPDLGKQFVEVGHGYGAVYDYGAMGLAYNKESVKDPPKTWQDFVDGTIAGKWKASIPGIAYSSTPVAVIWLYAHLYGGSVTDISPGLAKIKQMRDSGNLVFWNDVNQFLNQLKSGDVDIGMYWDGRAWSFHDDGNPDIGYLNPEPGAPISPTVVQKVKNGSDLAWRFINTMLSPEPQTCFAKILIYGMTNTKTEYPPDLKAKITPFDEVLWPPFEAIGPQTSRWVERWNKEIGN